MDFMERLVEMLDSMKAEGQIVDYRLEGKDLYVQPVVPVEHIKVDFVVSKDPT